MIEEAFTSRCDPIQLTAELHSLQCSDALQMLCSYVAYVAI